jgi:NAD(P)H-dependent flavin oxidoreductase YrpB (nitropropane dioxygenase family)
MNILYSIVQLGMTSFTTPDVVVAVSDSGGLGILDASRRSSSQLQKSIIEIKFQSNILCITSK